MTQTGTMLGVPRTKATPLAPVVVIGTSVLDTESSVEEAVTVTVVPSSSCSQSPYIDGPATGRSSASSARTRCAIRPPQLFRARSTQAGGSHSAPPLNLTGADSRCFSRRVRARGCAGRDARARRARLRCRRSSERWPREAGSGAAHVAGRSAVVAPALRSTLGPRTALWPRRPSQRCYVDRRGEPNFR